MDDDMVRNFFLILIGASYGFLAAAGVFTVLAAVGLVPRFAGKTHTGKYVLIYEEMVVFGTLTEYFFQILSAGGMVAGTVSRAHGFAVRHRQPLAGGLWAVCRDVRGMSGPCHCGDAGQHSHPYTPDLLPARSGAGHRQHGGGEALRLPALLLDTAASDGVG